MITHEEARQYAFGMLPRQIGSKSSRRKLDNYFKLDLYFRQQEKKDERAKKVEELMLIYKQYYNGYLSPADQKRRQDLEKELEELK